MSVSYTKTFTPDDILSFILNALKVACKDGDKTFFVYGGAPRDIIRGVPPRDIDVYIRNVRNISYFCTFLKNTGRLLKETKYLLDKERPYYLMSLEVSTLTTPFTTCSIDVSSEFNGSSTVACDFTCNNLTIDSQGKLGTRLPSPSDDISTSAWTMKCIRDAVSGTLTWMVPDAVSEHLGPKAYKEFQLKLKSRCDKMVQKGFSPPTSSLTWFQCKQLVTYQPSTSCTCPVCKEVYIERPEKETTVLKCGHNFHLDCIDSWVKTKRYVSTCPVCREAVELCYA